MKSEDTKKILEQLVQMLRDRRGSSNLNSWDRVEEIRNELLTDTANYPWRAGCEELWSLVSAVQNDEYLTLKRNEQPADDPISALIYWLEIPMYPPIEVLLAIVESFQIYFAAQGSLTLEEAFFGPPRKGVGNYAARKAKDFSYRMFDMFRNAEELKAKKRGDRVPDMECTAAKYLAYRKSSIPWEALRLDQSDENHEDPESFLRSYRRWKKVKSSS